MAVSLITAAIAIGTNLAGAITATQLAFTLFSTFATTVISGSLSKRGRNEKSPIPVSVREPTASHKIVYGTTRVGGTVVFIGSTDRVTTTQSGTRTEEDYFLHILIAVAGHEINAFKKMYFGDELVWDSGTYQDRESGTNWNTFVDLYVHEGDQTTADTILLNGEQISATVEQTAMDGWTADHKLQGIAYAHIRLKYVPEAFPTGAPQVSFVIEGKKVYDPDTATTAFSNNPALCIRDYLTDTRYGLGEASANIDDTSFINIKDICDEDVALDGGGTQKRYTADGMLDTSVSIKENLAQLLTSFNGELSYSGGKFYLTGGEYITPTVTISEADIVGPLQIVTKASRRDTYNGVKGVFAAEENNYIDTDYPTATSSIYEAKDGEQILLDVSLPFTTNNIRAQRIAKQIMLQSRQQVVITLPLNLVGMKFKAGDTFYFTNTRLGYSNKPFKVQGWDMSFGDDGEIIVNVTAREAGAVLHPETADTYLTDIYQWQTSDEQAFVVTGQIPVPNASIVAPPTNLAATQSTIISSDGTVSSDFEITWTESENSFVDRYQLQYRRTNSITGADGSTIAAETEPTSIFVFGTRYVLTGIADGDQYEVKIRALTPLGVQSNFATINLTATGDVTAPAIPTVNDIIKSDNKITLEFIAPSDKDTAHVDIFRVDDSRNIAASTGFGAMGSSPSGSGETVTDPSLRESPVTPDANTEPSVSVDATPGRIGYAVFNNVDNERIHFFFLRSRDYSGNVSDWSSVVRSIPEEEFQRGATKGAPDVVNDPEYGGNGKIKVGLVVADSIDAGAVTAEKIEVDNLAAIKADLGSITAGTLKGGSIPNADDVPEDDETGAFLNLTQGKFVFGSADHNILFDGTDLKINGDIITNLGGTSNNRIVYDGDIMDITGTLSSDEFTSGYTLAASTSTTLDRKLDSQTGDFYGYWDLRDSSGNSLTLTNLESIQDGDFLYFADGSILEQIKVEGSSRFRLEWSADYYIEFSLGEFFRSYTPRYVRGKITVVTARSSTKDFADVSGIDADVITGRRYDYDPADSRGWILKNSGDVEAQAITAKEINQLYIHNHLATNIVIGTTTTLDQVTSGRDNIVIGDGAGGSTTTGSDNIYIGKEAGSQADSGADNNVVIGNETKFFGTGFTESAVIGYRAHGVGYRTVALGFQAKAGTYTDASTYTEADFSVAIGTNSTVTGESGIAIGNYAYTTGQDGVALGHTATASGTDSIAIGDATASGNDSIAIGNAVTVTANDTIKIGTTQTAVTVGNYDLSSFITSADGGNAATLDSLDSTQFLRSDADDTMVGNLQIQSTDAGATAGPTLDLYRNSASPATSDELGKIVFSGEDASSAKVEFATITTSINDPFNSTNRFGRFKIDLPVVANGSSSTKNVIDARVNLIDIGEAVSIEGDETTCNGDLDVQGTLANSVAILGFVSKSSGSFNIKHPLVEKEDTHRLVHSFIEGPKADLIYRGKIQLVNGEALVNIDEAAGMTEGTFVALCRDVQCFTTNETGWTAVKGSVADNLLSITAQDGSCDDVVSWLVIGERQDEHMFETEWTDENGHVVVEPLIKT